MASHFTGKRAVVTGSASGIGLATVRMLRDYGAEVIGVDLERGQLDAGIEWITCDVTRNDQVSATFEVIGEMFSCVDIVVNSAGVGAIGTIEDATEDEWARVWNTNVVGIARVSSAALPLLRQSNSPSITNICSIAATVGLPDRAVYSASKGAVLALTRAMAVDFLSERIRVNCVNPGTADTPWVDRLLEQSSDPKAEKAALNARQPLGRMVTPEEVASAVCFLADPAQGSTTGISLAVDGGMDALRPRNSE
jgi:NAD(P)-dependent dehydrogenase (short-subunit alcohol dehydrogenase family)